MKYSIYNSVLLLNSNFGILYSGLSDKFVVFKKELSELLDKDITILKNTSKVLFDQLVEAEAIIPNERDEFEELKQLSKNIDQSTDQVMIIINPTLDCNFKCWYCYESHIRESKIDQETITGINLLINNILQENRIIKSFVISFFGGEPILQYNVVERIINHSREQFKNHNINYEFVFTTNGYLLNPYIISHLSSVDDSKSFQITLDGDRETHNKIRYEKNNRTSNSYDIILSNIKQLLKAKIEVILRVNYTSKNISSMKNVIADIEDISEDDRKCLKISFHKVWQDDGKKSDSNVVNEVIDLFKKKFDNVSDKFNMNDLRYPCYGDRKGTFVINYNGDVFKCTARDFISDNRYGILSKNGKINWDKEKLLTRENAKMNKDVCKICRILPLCGGGCSQNSLEYAGDQCRLGFTELDKDEVILSRFCQKNIQ